MKTAYQYAVVETWGDVPDQIAAIVNKPDAHLLYNEDRGEVSQQEFFRAGAIVGGWVLEFRGICETEGNKVVRSSATSASEVQPSNAVNQPDTLGAL